MKYDDYEELMYMRANGIDYEEWMYMKARFREPGGKSALHPGKRTKRCPTCGRKNALTVADVRAGYQCDSCANMVERGGY